MKPIGSRGLFVRDDGPGAAAAPAGPEPAARRARTGSAPGRKRTLAVLAAAGAAAAALWAGTAQSAAAATLTAGPGGLQSAGLASAPGPRGHRRDQPAERASCPASCSSPPTRACRRA